MGVTSLGRHTRPACTQGFTRSLKLCEKCGFNSCVRVFFIPWGHVENHAHIWAFVTSISHMGEMRDSDWSRQFLLRSDWLLPSVASITTYVWTWKFVSGKKKLRTQKYPHTCWRGLKAARFIISVRSVLKIAMESTSFRCRCRLVKAWPQV